MKAPTKAQRLAILAALALPAASFLLAQGPLTPPGAPTPTMKTLDQIEARRPVQSLAATAPYNITQPGSYYLTGNITVATGDAIVITSDDVSLDLNGFTIRSTFTGGSTGAAVKVDGFRWRLTVRNGSIVSGTTVPASGPAAEAGFTNGIFADGPFIGGSIYQALVSDVHVTGVGTAGILLNNQGVVERCTVSQCGHSGIIAEDVQNCSAEFCRVHGISVTRNATNCSGNARDGAGLECVNASNCTGTSTNGPGLYCYGNATNCTGTSTSGNAGMQVTGTASFCRGSRVGGVAIIAANAIGCTVGSGTVDAPLKHLGTP